MQSSVANSLANTAGWRKSLASTMAVTFTLEVAAAMIASPTSGPHCSRRWSVRATPL